MTRRFGDRDVFAVEVGEAESVQLRIVDIGGGPAADHRRQLGFLPFFCRAMRSTAAQVRERGLMLCPYPGRTPEETLQVLEQDETEFREQFRFMQWGETVDNVSRYAYLDGDLVLVFAFWRPTHLVPQDRGKAFVARIPPDQLVTILEDAADVLDAEPGR